MLKASSSSSLSRCSVQTLQRNSCFYIAVGGGKWLQPASYTKRTFVTSIVASNNAPFFPLVRTRTTATTTTSTTAIASQKKDDVVLSSSSMSSRSPGTIRSMSSSSSSSSSIKSSDNDNILDSSSQLFTEMFKDDDDYHDILIDTNFNSNILNAEDASHVSYTPEQERAFRLERQRMITATERILSLRDKSMATSQLSKRGFRREVTEAFKYWINGRAIYMEEISAHQHQHNSGDSYSEVPMEGSQIASLHAERLLKWMVLYGDPDLVQSAVRSNHSSVVGLVRLINNYMINFRGTRAGNPNHFGRDGGVGSGSGGSRSRGGGGSNYHFQLHRIRREASWESLQQSLASALRICRVTQELIDSPGFPNIQPDLFSCNAFLGLWSKQCWLLSTLGMRQRYTHNVTQQTPRGARLKQLTDCITQMEQLIHTMETNDRYPKPDIFSYDILIMGLVYSGLPNYLKRAREVVLSMDPPSPCAYNSLLWGYGMYATKDPAYARQARELMQQIQLLSDQLGRDDFKPDVIGHSSLIMAYTNAGLPEEAEKYLYEMEENAPRTNVYPNIICYNSVMAAWSKSDRPEALDKVLAMFHRILNMKLAGMSNVSPDRITYGLVIEAYARSSLSDGAERAEALLFQTAEDEDRSLRPDLITYNQFLSSLAKRGGGTKSAELAEKVLRRMLQQHEWSPNTFPAPDLSSYNCCIHAWTNSGDPDALQRAHDVLTEVETAYQNGKTNMKPNLVTFNTILATLARSDRPDAVQMAENLLARMDRSDVNRDIFTYNTFLDVLASQSAVTGQSSDRAMLILHTMEDEYTKGRNDSIRPNMYTYNTVLKAIARNAGLDAPIRSERILHRMIHLSQTQQGRQDLRPGVITFTTVLDTWAKSGRADALPRMEKLLDIMHQYAKPNIVSINTILSAIGKSGLPDAGQRAEAVLQKLSNDGSGIFGGRGGDDESGGGNSMLKPNNFTFSTLIACWARSEIPGSADRAEAYFRRMQELYEAGNTEFKPAAKTYTSLLDAWTKNPAPDSAQRALNLLNEIEERRRTDPNYFVPNAYTYNAIMNCIAKTETMDRKMKSIKEVYLRQLQDVANGNTSAQPNTVTYTIMVNGCAYSRGSTAEENVESFYFAQEAMEEVRRRNLKPNSYTYANYLLCCRYLLQGNPTLRDEKAQAAFKESCDRGLLTQKLVQVYRGTVSAQVYAASMINTVKFLDSSFSKLSKLS